MTESQDTASLEMANALLHAQAALAQAEADLAQRRCYVPPVQAGMLLGVSQHIRAVAQFLEHSAKEGIARRAARAAADELVAEGGA